MTAPNIESSTREERLDYVLNEWRCLHNCEPMEQREQKPNLFGLCRVATEEGEANAAWGGQWDAKEIMISMGAHATTENLNDCPDFTVAFATKRTIHNLAVLIAERCAPKSQDFVDYWTHKTGKNAPSREIFLQKE